MRPIRIYADTSVFGGVYDQGFAKASSAFLDQVRSGKFLLKVSATIEEEIALAPEEVKKLYRSLAGLVEVLNIKDEVVQLRDAYLEAGVVTNKWKADAVHVAYATAYGCQMIVSWNFRHIVHYDKIALYNAINIKLGYAPVGIHSPQEVIDYEEEI